MSSAWKLVAAAALVFVVIGPSVPRSAAVTKAVASSSPRLGGDASAERMSRPTGPTSEARGAQYPLGAPVARWCPAIAVAPRPRIAGYPPMCFHWVSNASFDDAPSLLDTDGDTVPQWVETNAAIFRRVWDHTVTGRGFRPPLPDAGGTTRGGNTMLDIYLADLAGAQYGYCEPDNTAAPSTTNPRYRAVHCVVDDDYAADDMCPCPPNVIGIDALKITAAHEFFHAVQCAYDCFEPTWLSEGTAVWAEDDVGELASTPGAAFDAINQHYWYLGDSQMFRPNTSLNSFGADDDEVAFEYGAFLLWKRLAERWGVTFVRDVWQRVGARRGDRNQPLLTALDAELNERDAAVPSTRTGEALRRALNAFAADNYYYEDRYTEGGAVTDPVLPDGATATSYYQHIRDRTALRQRPPSTDHTLAGATATANGSALIAGLAHSYRRFVMADGVPAGYQLRVAVNGPAAASRPAATLVVRRGPTNTSYVPLTLNASGDGFRIVNLAGASEVLLVLTNAGTGGTQTFTYTAKVQPPP